MSSSSKCRKPRPNPFIIGGAILPQTGTKLNEKRGSKFGALLWCHLTPEKNGNIGAQLQSITWITAPKTFWKIYYLYDFWCAQTCLFWAVFATAYTNFDICCQCYIATWKIFLYRCTSTFSALNYCSGIFFRSLSYLCTQTFPLIFWMFAIFDRHFPEFVAPSSDEYENHVLSLKGRSLPKKRWKPHQNRPINRNIILFWTMSTSNEQRSGLGVWQITHSHYVV